MKTTLIALTALSVIALVSPVALANPGGGNSWFGLCTAHNNNGTGQENGNPENAPPFQQLAQHAEDEGYDTVEEFCDTVPHPGGGNPGGPPDDTPSGPPS